jgi:predicted TIM-barrel fold metal-dependent hydrolase
LILEIGEQLPGEAMSETTRRKALAGMVLTPLLASCDAKAPVNVAAINGLIDTHCHLFNESDLPTVRFLGKVFLHKHDPVSLGEVENPKFLDGLIWLFARVFAGKGPDAAKEIRVLTRTLTAADGRAGAEDIEAEVDRDLAEYLTTPIDTTRTQEQQEGEILVRQAIMAEGGMEGPRTQTVLSRAEAEPVAAAAVRSLAKIGVYLRWFRDFRRYRHQLTDRLADMHAKQGFKPLLMTPAMIDYSRWLRETPRSPLADQVAVFSEIAKRPGPAVHGYVAYDPLHQIFAEMKIRPDDMSNRDWAIEQRETPLDIVKRAVLESGFLGVKLYPPMGFRAARNGDGAMVFPDPVKKNLKLSSLELGRKLDAALNQLYDFCVAHDVPIMAHGGEGNEAGPDFGKRADPSFWMDVLKARPKLRVSLAHFGGFEYKAADPASGQPPPLNATWEGVIASFVKANPDRPLYADLAYYSSVMNVTPAVRQTLAGYINSYMKSDPRMEHIVFGTDWIMLGNLPKVDTYDSQIRDFLKKDCGLNDKQMANVMWRNAVRFLGLGAGAASRKRLETFYAKHGVDAARLKAFDA